jgi:hypothetical protein
MGVTSAKIYPKKLGDFVLKFSKLPPVINNKPPIEATMKLMTFNLLISSLKKKSANIETNTGDNKHKNNAGNEGPIISIAEYSKYKYNDTPVKLANKINDHSFIENWDVLDSCFGGFITFLL